MASVRANFILPDENLKAVFSGVVVATSENTSFGVHE